jgi:hypothetical protein
LGERFSPASRQVFLPAAAGGGLKVSAGIFLKIGSDFNQNIPPFGKRSVWLALCEGSPADFEREIEFFVFVPQSGTPEAGFSESKL